jgi:hypothetical protein
VWVSGHDASSVQLRGVNHASRPSLRCLASLSIGCRRIYRCRSELDKHNFVERAVRCAGRRVLQRSIANLQARCWPAFPRPAPDVHTRRSPSPRSSAIPQLD